MSRKSSLFLFVASLLVTSAAAASARAEEAPPADTSATSSSEESAAPSGAHLHDGFYMRIVGGSVGYGSLSSSGPAGHTNMIGGGDGMLMLGGTPTPGLTVGGMLRQQYAYGELTVGDLASERVNGMLNSVGPFVDWYPNPKKGWHVGASVGAGFSIVEGPSTLHSIGNFSGMVFGGHDWWIGDDWSLGLLVAVSAGTSSALLDSHGDDTGFRIAPTSAALDVAVTFQ